MAGYPIGQLHSLLGNSLLHACEGISLHVPNRRSTRLYDWRRTAW